MSDVPALHIRDVSDEVLTSLRERARENGRSLNAELLSLLSDAARRYRERGEMTRRLAEIAERINLPPDAPRPEDLIRADRDSR